jgi:CHAD domain-containing protein
MKLEANSDMMLSEEENNRLEQLFSRLAKSKFRSRFKLGKSELNYLQDKGLSVIEQHTRDFVKERLAPALPKNDGKQTPMKNHPVFIAQHATATCCRKCLEKWHRIERGKELTQQQVDYIVSVIIYWLRISPILSDSSI